MMPSAAQRILMAKEDRQVPPTRPLHFWRGFFIAAAKWNRLRRGILIYAPVSGRVRPLPQIEDPVFSSEALGKGCAIEPSGDAIVAPFDGVVEQIAQTKHAVGLRSETGVELLIHVGMDTVELKGLGFAPQVQVGDRVKQGQLLLKFNRTAIAAAGYRVTTPVVVTNTAAFKSVQVIASGTVIEGQKLLLLC